MFEQLLLFSCFATIGLSCSLAPLGCFLVWRQQAFFGDAMAHSAILGVGLSFLWGIAPLWGIILVCVSLSALLAYGPAWFKLPSDAWLGLLSYTLVAAGYILMKSLPKGGSRGAASVEQFLFGDLLLLDQNDLISIITTSVIVISFLYFYWRPLILVTMDAEGATVDGLSPRHVTFLFMIVLSCVIATTLPLVGALLVPGVLILPAACAAQASRSPEGMVCRAVVLAALMMFLGMGLGFWQNWPVGPSSMIVGFILFLLMRCYTWYLTKRSTVKA